MNWGYIRPICRPEPGWVRSCSFGHVINQKYKTGSTFCLRDENAGNQANYCTYADGSQEIRPNCVYNRRDQGGVVYVRLRPAGRSQSVYHQVDYESSQYQQVAASTATSEPAETALKRSDPAIPLESHSSNSDRVAGDAEGLTKLGSATESQTLKLAPADRRTSLLTPLRKRIKLQAHPVTGSIDERIASETKGSVASYQVQQDRNNFASESFCTNGKSGPSAANAISRLNRHRALQGIPDSNKPKSKSDVQLQNIPLVSISPSYLSGPNHSDHPFNIVLVHGDPSPDFHAVVVKDGPDLLHEPVRSTTDCEQLDTAVLVSHAPDADTGFELGTNDLVHQDLRDDGTPSSPAAFLKSANAIQEPLHSASEEVASDTSSIAQNAVNEATQPFIKDVQSPAAEIEPVMHAFQTPPPVIMDSQLNLIDEMTEPTVESLEPSAPSSPVPIPIQKLHATPSQRFTPPLSMPADAAELNIADTEPVIESPERFVSTSVVIQEHGQLLREVPSPTPTLHQSVLGKSTDAIIDEKEPSVEGSRQISVVNEASSPSVCLMPCKCQRCFFSSKESFLSRMLYSLRSFSKDNDGGVQDNDGGDSRARSEAFSLKGDLWSSSKIPWTRSGSNMSNSEPEAHHGWRRDDGRGSAYASHRSVSPKRRTSWISSRFDMRGSSSSNFGRNPLPSSQLESPGRPSESIDLTSSYKKPDVSRETIVQQSSKSKETPDLKARITAPAQSTYKIPVRRILSAAEKQAIFANAKFTMRTPVLSKAAIPRLDEDHRPKRPLVRPVYSSPSARLSIRPAKLVAYRSDSKHVKEEPAEPDDELCTSLSDEAPIVSEDVAAAEEFAEDETEEALRYIRYAKGRIGVQLPSLSSSSSNITNKGLYCELVFPRRKQRFLLPLPLAEGAAMLNENVGFKLPFSIAHSRLAEMELDELRKTGTFITNPPPFFITNRNIRLPGIVLPEYAGGDEILDCQCFVDVEPGCGSNCINRLTHVECEPDQCKLGDACTNQRFQKRLWSKVTVDYMGEKGWGLCLAQDVRQGDLIIEYVGELIDLETCKDRCRNEYRSEKHFYLFSLYKNIIIDATRRGNVGRFCNHSCEPTCETQKWSVRGSPRIGIFAHRDLQKGTEVTLDYNFERIGLAMTKCLCGTESCRGFLGAPRSKRRKDAISFGLDDYDITRDGPLILDAEEQVLQVSEHINRNQLSDSFLSMVAEIGTLSTQPALLVRNVVRVHASFMDRLEYNPGHS